MVYENGRNSSSNNSLKGETKEHFGWTKNQNRWSSVAQNSFIDVIDTG